MQIRAETGRDSWHGNTWCHSCKPHGSVQKTPTKNGVFEVSQDDVISTQAAYNSAYNDNFPEDNFVRIGDSSYTFQTLTGTTVTLPLQPKAIQDEMERHSISTDG